MFRLRIDADGDTNQVGREALVSENRLAAPVTVHATCKRVQMDPLVHLVSPDHTELGHIVIPVGLVILIAGEFAVT